MRTYEPSMPIPDPSWKYGPPEPPTCDECDQRLEGCRCPDCGWIPFEDIGGWDTMEEREEFYRERDNG